MANNEKADRALGCLWDHPAFESEDIEASITDLITDLRHLADREELDWERISRMAEGHFEEER